MQFNQAAFISIVKMNAGLFHDPLNSKFRAKAAILGYDNQERIT